MDQKEQNDNQSPKDCDDACTSVPLPRQWLLLALFGPPSLKVVLPAKLHVVTVGDHQTWNQRVTTTVKSVAYMLRRFRSQGRLVEGVCVYLTFIVPKLIYASCGVNGYYSL